MEHLTWTKKQVAKVVIGLVPYTFLDNLLFGCEISIRYCLKSANPDVCVVDSNDNVWHLKTIIIQTMFRDQQCRQR